MTWLCAGVPKHELGREALDELIVTLVRKQIYEERSA